MLQKKAPERHENFSEEEKSKKEEYGFERYETLPEDQKQGWLNWLSIEKIL